MQNCKTNLFLKFKFLEFKTPIKNTFSNVNLSLDSITKSISNLTAEVMDIKNFIMDELYRLSRSIDRVKTEQIDQTNFMDDVKKIWEENSNKNEIIKTLLENLSTITSFLYKPSDKNIDKGYGCGHSRGDKFKMPKNKQQMIVCREQIPNLIINLNIDRMLL